MENDILTTLWSGQDKGGSRVRPEEIVAKAKKQRTGQHISIVVMGLTVSILLVYAAYFAPANWNTFTGGLALMTGSLLFRVLLEFFSVYKKERQLISMDNKSYHAYLKKHYSVRLIINYYITPLCFILYSYGFYLLLPYFKREFSGGFYNYLLISGILSILAIIGIVIRSIIRERRFLRELNTH